MLIPIEAATNIHCVDNVLFIQWHVFGIDVSSVRGSKGSCSSFETLDQAWHELVRSGYHASHASKAKVLWVFELSSTFSSSRIKPPLHDIARKFKLKKISFGSLRACDLEGLSRVSQIAPGQAQAQAQAQKHNQTTPGSPGQDTQSPVTFDYDARSLDTSPVSFQPSSRQIYDAFITATYDLFVFNLTSRLSVIPLCANVYVQLESRGDSSSVSRQDGTVKPHPYVIIKSTSSIGVEWLSNGRLFVASCPTRTSLRPISTSIRRYEWIPWGDCFLAPFGIRIPAGGVRRKKVEVEKSRHQTKTRFLEREKIFSMLERRGIYIPKEEEWVQCHFPEEAEALPSTLQGKFLMWPCSLVYIYEQSSCPPDVGKCVSPQAFMDAFSTSGMTSAGAAARAAPDHDLDEQKQGDEKDPFLHILDNKPGSGGVHSIYPTPPDLVRSLPNSQVHRPSAFSAPTPATVSSMPAPGDAETPSMAPDQVISPNDGVDIRLGDDADHDDLFGDLAIEMGTEALNEDEFGFFDVQRPSTGKSGTSLDQSPMEERRGFGTSPLMPSPVQTRRGSIDQSQLRSEPDMPTAETEIEDAVMQDEDLAKTTTQSTFLAPRQEPSPAKAQPPTLDAKYALGGVYNASKPKELSTQSSERPTVTRSIPIITRPSFRNDISDSSSEETDGDDSDYMDDDNDDEFDDSNDNDMEQEDDYNDGYDEDDKHNLNDDSDISMDGDDCTLSSINLATKSDLAAPSMISVEELAKARMPMLICQTRLGPKGETSRIMANYNLKPSQYIELAQLVAQQLCYYEGGLPGLPEKVGPDLRAVLKTVEQLFDKAASLDIESCASVVRTTKQQIDSPYSPSAVSEDMTCTLRTSDIVVERDGTELVMSASSLSIWVELGLAPSGGLQDVQCYCFTPDVPAWLHGSKDFLEMLHDTFASMRLGRHDLGTVGAANSLKLDGVVGIETADSFQQFRVNLAKAANIFDKLIRSSGMEEHTDVMVIYIVNPTPAEETHVLPALCSVFQRLQYSLEAHDITLVLKVLPGSLVAQDNALNMPTPSTLVQLAREMYERISQADGPPSPLTYLAASLPTSVPMRLENNPTRRPLDHDTILHLAYSWTPASPWLTFALCDALGKTKYSSAYYVPWRSTSTANTNSGMSSGPSNPSTPINNPASQPPTPGGAPGHATSTARPSPWTKDNVMGRFVEAIKNLWSSLDKLFPQPKSGMHKLIIVKDSPPAHAQEVHVWKMLAQSRTNMELIFLIIDPECPITLVNFSKPSQQGHINTEHYDRSEAGAGRITSTPNTPSASSLAAGVGSHAQANLGAPGRDPAVDDPNARLVRTRDEAWLVEAKTIFAVNPVGKLEIIPGVGGCCYMVSRVPAPPLNAVDDSVRASWRNQSLHATVVSVRVQFARAGPQGVNMREIMNAYKGLTTISEVVGLDTQLPWHVATARRARVGLARCM